MRAAVHSMIYLVGLCLIAVFMPVSPFVTNACIIAVTINFVVEGNFRAKLRKLLSNKTLCCFLLLFVVHVVGLINTSDFGYAFADLRKKLPLLVLPIVVGTSSPVGKRQLTTILTAFVVGVVISVAAGTLAYFDLCFHVDLSNARSLSVFVSHIRLALMINLAIFIIIHFIRCNVANKLIIKLLASIVALWLLLFMFAMQVLTGIVIFVALVMLELTRAVVRAGSRRRRVLAAASLAGLTLALMLIVVLSLRSFYTPINPFVQRIDAPGYFTDTSNRELENGNYVYENVCMEQLTAAWNARSSVAFDSLTTTQQPLWRTLVRYLTSKGLTKDAAGVNSLTINDIRNIEHGETNYRYVGRSTIFKRIYTTIWEVDVYLKGASPDGHSQLQRLAYLRYGFMLVRQHLWAGTGTGDVDACFKALYRTVDSGLSADNQRRAHNQYLTFFIAFGIVGGILCMFAWFFPLFRCGEPRSPLFVVFFVVVSISMFTDDTLETNTGVVFTAFLYALLRWGTVFDKKANR